MSFTYPREIPSPTHSPSNEQPVMRTNTNSLDNLLLVDHVSFNDASNSGKHIHVTFPTPQSDPGLLTSQTQIYPKTFTGDKSTLLESYEAAKMANGNQINGYSPFVKAMGLYTIVNNAPGTYPLTAVPNSLNVNIASVSQVVTGVVGVITVTFTTALPTTKYFVFLSTTTASFSSTVVSSQDETKFVLSSGPLNSNLNIGFMVI